MNGECGTSCRIGLGLRLALWVRVQSTALVRYPGFCASGVLRTSSVSGESETYSEFGNSALRLGVRDAEPSAKIA